MKTSFLFRFCALTRRREGGGGRRPAAYLASWQGIRREMGRARHQSRRARGHHVKHRGELD